jgi:hypothetical protein
MNIFGAGQSVEYLLVSLNSKSNPVRGGIVPGVLCIPLREIKCDRGKSNAKAQSELAGAKANHFPSGRQVAN